jgi:F-type H+-transporting ATPase subunit delta
LPAVPLPLAVSLILQDKPYETAVASDSPIVSGVAGRYATALFELAREAGTLDSVQTSLAQFKAALDASGDLRQLVKSAVFSAADQVRALNAVFVVMELDSTAQNLLLLLAKNRRLSLTENVMKGFNALLASMRGEISAHVVSAQPLTDEQIEALAETLHTHLGKTPKIEANVDPSLLGGLVVKVGSRMIDSSLKTQLNSLKLLMKEVA